MTMRESEELRHRPTGELVRTLSEQASRLVRKEIELAKTELTEKGKRAGVGLAALVAAAVVALVALGTLSAALVLALDNAMPSSLAALLVTLLWTAVAIGFALYGRREIQEIGTPVPEQTVETVKEDIEWLKHPTS